ncbi:MAG: PKD domain-containing protein [Methanosarcina vacuolata]|jgi:beta propeller repeat protein|nr:PKD domain-containing protein [Methanosarcina vacuolata]
MKEKRKSFSVALAATALVLFLIFVSPTTSAQTEPEITSGVGDTSDEQVLSDGVPTEVGDIATESIQTALPKITETRITTNASGQQNPVIYGDKIVWEDDRNGNWDIYMYDLSTSTETQITTNESNQTDPAIDGNRIIWADDRNGSMGDIYMYDLSTKKETRITKNGWALNPDIYGNKVVYQRSNGYQDSGIFLYNLSTKSVTQIAEDSYQDDDWGGTEHSNNLPVIYGNSIVWLVHDCTCDMGSSDTIFLYNLSTKETNDFLVYAGYMEGLGCPHIYNDRIVYVRYIYSMSLECNIYMYNLSTHKEYQITTSGSASDPAIYGDRIVWQDRRNGNADIYMYDLSTSRETQITTDKSDQSYPNINGERIVWTDYRNGNADIYMGILTTSPIADFSASPTSGKAPLKVQFTDESIGKPTKWKWSFGDGTTSTQQSPTHKYSKVGRYTVKLTATNAEGSNTVTKTDYIKVVTKPVAAFSAKPTSGKAPLTVAFTDKSTGIPTKWKWSFGDGKTSTIQNPKHQYLQEGKYKVTLTVTNVAGSSTATKTNYIKVTTNTRPGIYSESE